MASYTTFSEEALSRYLVMFGRGALESYAPVTGGIENSNYFVTLRQDSTQEFVLTILEGLSFDDASFFNKLLSRLYQFGLPVAAPEATLDGMASTVFCGKPTFLFRRLKGRHIENVGANHCTQIGEFMARCHAATDSISVARDNPYSADWMAQTQAELRLPAAHQQIVSAAIDDYRQLAGSGLPAGLIHGDLFRDNALFLDETLSGVIDFYHACHDFLLQDLAIAINDWCRTGDGVIDADLQAAMVSGYQSKRQLTEDEVTLLPRLQKISAVRFALTRYLSGTPPLKDPGEMLQLAESIQ